VARLVKRLTAKKVEHARKPGYCPDGANLYLQVSSSGSKSWIFRYTINGREREMGLGSLLKCSLTQARDKAGEKRSLLDKGIDPLEEEREREAQRRLAEAKSLTFAECATEYIKSHRADWKNTKHAEQWTTTLKTYAEPLIGKLPVADVDVALVVKVLRPIWIEKPETATRLRARIERVLDWATVSQFREGDNPARWKGKLDHLLPALKKKSRVKHHASLPYSELGVFFQELRKQEGPAARALEFCILTAARTGEVIGARREDFDLDNALWTVPGERMKAGRPHRVPLSHRAVELVRETEGEQVFPLSNMAMLKLLERMGRDTTVHGFRSSFRVWGAEQTNYPREVLEAALAHVIGDETEAAYMRSDLFLKRRRLMEEWSRYCERTETAKVLPLRESA
jgi:integrase